MSAAERFARCYGLMDALDGHLAEFAHDAPAPQRPSPPRERATAATGTRGATRGHLAASAPVGGA